MHRYAVILHVGGSRATMTRRAADSLKIDVDTVINVVIRYSRNSDSWLVLLESSVKQGTLCIGGPLDGLRVEHTSDDILSRELAKLDLSKRCRPFDKIIDIVPYRRMHVADDVYVYVAYDLSHTDMLCILMENYDGQHRFRWNEAAHAWTRGSKALEEFS